MDENIDPALATFLGSQGYIALRLMPDGHIAGINPFIFTFGLCTKLDFHGYDQRWCYSNPVDAIRALNEWSGDGDPPGPWIKQKGGIERHNPKLYAVLHVYPDGSEYAIRKENVSETELWAP